MCKSIFLKPDNLKRNSRKPTDCMTLLHFHSHHPLSCKEGIIYSQALLNNMIISKDHILKKQCNNLTGILIARTNPLHVIIKKIKKSLDKQPELLVISTNTLYRNWHYPYYNSFFGMGKQLTAIIHRNCHIVANDTTLSTIWPSKPLPAYSKSKSIHNHLVHSAQPYGSWQ